MPLADCKDRLGRFSVLRKPNRAGKTLLHYTLSEGLSAKRTKMAALRSALGKGVGTIRLISRLTVDGARPSRLAIDRAD